MPASFGGPVKRAIYPGVAVALLASVLTSPFSARAQHAASDPEAYLKAIALSAARSYLRPELHIYSPRRDGKERAASTIAVQAHILLEAWKVNGDPQYLAAARAAGDSLLRHADMSGDGKLGWGRYWNIKSGSGDGAGGNTPFYRGCSLARDKAYEDETYDNGRILQFLLPLYSATRSDAYLAAAIRVVEDTWSNGARTLGGRGFVYNKTGGPCSAGWGIKNINVLMLTPMAELAAITGRKRYRDRASQLLAAAEFEVFRTVDGQPAPNLGYYTSRVQRERPVQGKYVELAQLTTPSGAIVCNLRTSTGRSCALHLGIEARGLYLAQRTLGRDRSTQKRTVDIIMAGWEPWDSKLCSQTTDNGKRLTYHTGCTAYYCYLRQFRPQWQAMCVERTKQYGARSQDHLLALFTGVPQRGR